MSTGGGLEVRWDIFLAHAGPDTEAAGKLHDALEAAGIEVCFDGADLRGGDNWHQLLPQYLRESRIVVALVSEHTSGAHYENSEIVLAVELVRREGRRLVPVRLADNVDPPYGTEPLHVLDYFNDASLPDLVNQLVDLVRNPERIPSLLPAQVWCERIPEVSKWFTRRDDTLALLSDTLAKGGTKVLTQTVNGMGGVGKTTVAAKVAADHREYLDVVWWVRAEDPTTLTADLAELGPLVGLPTADDPVDGARLVRTWLERTERRWLLVFDNAVDEPSLEPWRPRSGTGTVLVTSRNRNFDRIGAVIDVAVFDGATAEAFLRDRVRDRNLSAAEEPAAAEVADLLDGLPLALEQGAAWVARAPSRRFAQFAELWRDDAREPFPDTTVPIGYEATAFTTWRVSLAAATAEQPVAERLMWALGYFAPEHLPIDYLVSPEIAADGYLQASPAEVEDALVALHGYALIELGDSTIDVHRVIQAAARRLGHPSAGGFALRVLRAQCRGGASDHRSWPTLQAVLPHAMHAASVVSNLSGDDGALLWWVLDDVATYLTASGAVDAGLEAATRVAELATTYFGADHPETLTSLNNLASAHESAGQLDRAITLHKATLTDRQRILGDNHPKTLASRNNLAGAYRAAGQLDRAIPLFEATLTDCQRILGDDHPNTLSSRNNLASAYRAADQLDRAIPLYEATLTDRQRILGDDDPDTLQSRNNLATAYRAAGQLDRAIPLLEATLTDYQRILGDDHPSTLSSRNNLATAYGAAGQTDRAIALLEANLTESLRILGDGNPDTLHSRNNLAVAYQDAGQLDRAIPLFEATLTERQRILGDDHPDTLTSRKDLSYSYWTAGRRAEALELAESALRTATTSLSPTHEVVRQLTSDVEVMRRELER